jgi:hypothetical protein
MKNPLPPQGEGWDGGGNDSTSSVFSMISMGNVIYNNGTIISATILMILMSGFTAGPAVSL